MILQIGKAGKARFIYGVKKTNIFECGDMGMVGEREKKNIMLYATNARCRQSGPAGGAEKVQVRGHCLQ